MLSDNTAWDPERQRPRLSQAAGEQLSARMLSSLGSHAKEYKQQGAVEAAQNEDNPVNAEDAERVMIEESKKGGAAAFQFDPDASPEDKAAQAAAVSTIAIISSTNVFSDSVSYRASLQGFIAGKSPDLVSQPTSYVPAPVRPTTKIIH